MMFYFFAQVSCLTSKRRTYRLWRLLRDGGYRLGGRCHGPLSNPTCFLVSLSWSLAFHGGCFRGVLLLEVPCILVCNVVLKLNHRFLIGCPHFVGLRRLLTTSPPNYIATSYPVKSSPIKYFESYLEVTRAVYPTIYRQIHYTSSLLS